MHVEDLSQLLYKASTLLGPGTAASMTFAPIQQQTLEQTSHMMLEHGLVAAEPDVGVTCLSHVLVRHGRI